MKLITRFYNILILIIIQNINAQNFKIDTADYPQRKQFLTGYKEKSKIFNKGIKKYSGSENRELSKVFSAFQTSLEEDIKDRNYLFDERFISFVKEKVQMIANKNPDIPNDFNILIAKDNEPNAFNFGDNTLVVNSGLFYYLNNDNQFIGIICHEIAHAQLEHTINSILSRIRKNNDKKTEVSLLKKSANQQEKAFEMFRTMLYSNMKERREQEIRADSLGFEYYKKLGLQKDAFVSALQLLKSVDEQKPDSIYTTTYRKVFDIPNQKFKVEWLKMEDFSQYNYKLYTKKISEDSLKSHPNIDLRMTLLKQKITEGGFNQEERDASPAFKELKELAGKRIIPNYYDTEKYGLGIYNCLAILQKKPDDDFAKFYLGKFFNKIYEARKAYTLNRYLDKIDPKKQSYSYQQFLSLMWNLNLDEIRKIKDFYEKSES